MPNIASIFKGEIARIARKEVRAATAPVKAATSRYRAEIAELKRQVQKLEKQLRGLRKSKGNGAATETGKDSAAQHRFSAKGLASHRRRLGLSAAEFGLLVGVTGQSIYKWERGEGHPRPQTLPALAAAKRLGKREAASHVAALRQDQ